MILDGVFVRDMLQDLNKKTSFSFVNLHFIQVKGDQRGYKDFYSSSSKLHHFFCYFLFREFGQECGGDCYIKARCIKIRKKIKTILSLMLTLISLL